MTSEDCNNIDDLVDYQDFDSGPYENNLEDSFNDDILKFYEERKKGPSDKTTEAQNNQRPMSKYHRNANSAKEDINNNLKERNGEFTSFTDMSGLIERFNTYIRKHKISKEEFMDNPTIFFSFEDFKDLFKKIRFDISIQEADALFCYGNESNKDGYILGQTFLENFREKIEWAGLNKSGFKTGDQFVNPRVNAELKQMTQEIMDIVNDQSRVKSSRSVTKPKQTRAMTSQVKPLNLPKRDFSGLNPNNSNSLNVKLKPFSAKPHNFIRETMLKKKAEEEMIRLAIERKNKENERDCVKKMSEANVMAEVLGIPRCYSAHNDESEGGLICRIFDKSTKTTVDLDLKKFMMEWKKLGKLTKQKQQTRYYKPEEKTKTEECEQLLHLGREGRQKKIKDVLIHSLELKMKLKKQLKALRDKKIVDLSVIKANLKLIDLDDDNIF